MPDTKLGSTVMNTGWCEAFMYLHEYIIFMSNFKSLNFKNRTMFVPGKRLLHWLPAVVSCSLILNLSLPGLVTSALLRAPSQEHTAQVTHVNPMIPETLDHPPVNLVDGSPPRAPSQEPARHSVNTMISEAPNIIILDHSPINLFNEIPSKEDLIKFGTPSR